MRTLPQSCVYVILTASSAPAMKVNSFKMPVSPSVSQ